MNDAVKKIDDVSTLLPAQQGLFALFDRLGITHETYEHPAIFTVEEGIALDLPGCIPGLHGKNLFLKTKSGDLWLIVVSETTRVDLKALSDRLGVPRFSFARPEIMIEVLGVSPGSGTPFALINDRSKRVNVVLDAAFTKANYCVFHPLVNTQSTVIPVSGLMRFFAHLGYHPTLLELA